MICIGPILVTLNQVCQMMQFQLGMFVYVEYVGIHDQVSSNFKD